MWLVLLALWRPCTFVCVSLLIVIFGVFAILRMAVDIFPAINIPVVTLFWQYAGLSPEDMERRIVLPSERQYSSSVNDIEHIESTSEYGQAIIKVYFQPNANIGIGVGELAAVSEALARYLAPGISPPFIYRFNATDVPVIQLAVTSGTVPEEQ